MTWDVPAGWLRIKTIDAHTAGEPLRVVTDGWPDIPGKTILAMREYARAHHDDLRRAIILEPRGHADMYACLLVPPVTPDGDVGVLFLHNEGYSTMCGHGIIGLVKVGLDCALFDAQGDEPEIRIDTPAGRVTATAHRGGEGTVETVSFLNVPSFLLERDLVVDVDGLGSVTCDIAYGGAFYAYVDARSVGVEIGPGSLSHIVDVSRRIKRAVMAAYTIVHPDGDPELNFLYGTILHQPGEGVVHSRNVCVFADGEVDRSPTGTGVSGRAAILHARDEMADGAITIESLIGTRFDVAVHETTSVGGLPAVVPLVSGAAYITGRHEFFVDPSDPLRDGVLLR